MSEPQGNPALFAAENYEKMVVKYTTGLLADIVLEYAKPEPGEEVLDVACGTGIAARKTAPLVGEAGAIVGVDINPAMVSVARSLPVPEGASIDWREGNAQALPLSDESFDLVTCVHGLQFFPNRLAALREMFRVLRSGGRITLSVWSSLEHNPVSKLVWEAIAHHLNTTVPVFNKAFSLGEEGELSMLLESVGFADVKVVARMLTVSEPYTPQLIARILPATAAVLPAVAAMGIEERDALAQAIQTEVRPEFQKYVDGDEQLYPMSAHIAFAYKPGFRPEAASSLDQPDI